MRNTTEAIVQWWRQYGGLLKHVPNPILDDLDAAIRADERAKVMPYLPAPKVVAHTCLERRGSDGLLQMYEVITWEDGTMAYWSHEGRCWRAATNIPDYHAIREAWQAAQPRTSTITEEPNGPHD